MRLLCAKVMVRCVSASVAVGSELDVRGVSHLVCQRRCGFEENSRDMVSCSRMTECAWQNSFLHRFLYVWSQRLDGLAHMCGLVCVVSGSQRFPDISTMTKWFYSTRLETRTKESNICASSRVLNLLAQ